MCCYLKSLINDTGGTQVKQEDHNIHFKRAALAFGIIALVSAVALIVLLAAPQVAAVAFIATAIALVGGINNACIGLGILTGVALIAALIFKRHADLHS